MRWLLYAPLWLFASALGYFVLPFILAFTPFKSPKLRWLDGIYGNRVDGTGWDYPLGPGFFEHGAVANLNITMSGFTGWVGKWFPRYAWLALRNPANNLARRFGAHGIIRWIDFYGPVKVVDIGGKRYWFIHWKHYWTARSYTELKLGWKIWDSYKIGDKVDCALAVSFQPLRRDHV